jgi:hypothetical protein
MKKDLLRGIFRYPVPCYKCLDGPGHLLSHLLGREFFAVSQKITLFGKIQLEGRAMLVTCIIMSALSEDGTFSLASYFPGVDRYILRTLEEDIRETISSQFLLLIMIWNNLERGFRWRLLNNLAAIVVGIHRALRLSHDPKATFILGPLSLELLRLESDLSTQGFWPFSERELVRGEARIASQLLLTNLAVRSIFGRLNSHRISCAQATGDVPPALGWLPPYDG